MTDRGKFVPWPSLMSRWPQRCLHRSWRRCDAPLYAQDPWSSPGVQVIDSSGGGESNTSKAIASRRVTGRSSPPGCPARWTGRRTTSSSWRSRSSPTATPGRASGCSQSEQAVIHELGATSLEVLVPIAMLHHEAYSRLLAQGIRQAPLAVTHARSDGARPRDPLLPAVRLRRLGRRGEPRPDQSGRHADGARATATGRRAVLSGARVGRPQRRGPARPGLGLREERRSGKRDQGAAGAVEARSRPLRGPLPPGHEPEANRETMARRRRS